MLSRTRDAAHFIGAIGSNGTLDCGAMDRAPLGGDVVVGLLMNFHPSIVAPQGVRLHELGQQGPGRNHERRPWLGETVRVHVVGVQHDLKRERRPELALVVRERWTQP